MISVGCQEEGSEEEEREEVVLGGGEGWVDFVVDGDGGGGERIRLGLVFGFSGGVGFVGGFDVGWRAGSGDCVGEG